MWSKLLITQQPYLKKTRGFSYFFQNSYFLLATFSLECCNAAVTKIDYLRYKTIISQNVPSEAKIKNFFISKKNYVPFSRYPSFYIFNHSMIYQICDVTMNISTWDNLHFWIYLLNHDSWSHQTGSVDRYKQGQ